MITKTFPRLLCLSLLLMIGLGFISTKFQADMAPPTQPMGSNVIPGNETTQVRMVAEEVLIEVQSDLLPAQENDWFVRDWAKVTATFEMVNLGSNTETMEARFPLMNTSGLGDGYGNFPELNDFLIIVDGQNVSYRVTTTENPSGFEDTPIKWASFPISFNPGSPVHVKVTYTVRATGYSPEAGFGYTLETGAGWKDTIGIGKIIVRLPYEVSLDNFLVESTNQPFIFSGNDAVYEFINLEPTDRDNAYFSIVEPVIWSRVLTGRQEIITNPAEGAAWGNLAEAIREAIMYPKGWIRESVSGDALFAESMAAFQKAVDLDPQQFDWHYGFANLIWAKEYFSTESNMSLIQMMLEQFSEAYKINPDHEDLYYLLKNISETHPDWIIQNEQGFRFPTVIETPIPASTIPDNPVMTSSPKNEEAPENLIQASPTVGADEGGSANFNLSCCPGAAFPISGLIGIGLWNLSRKKEI